MEHYSVLLLVQDHEPEIPGLFTVSIVESEGHPDAPPQVGEFEVSAFQAFVVAWDGEKIQMLRRYWHGVPQAMPDNHAFDIAKVIEEYVYKRDRSI